MRTHHDLDAWKYGIKLTGLVYSATRRFPAEERYGLVTQMRRAATSVPTNIAEGSARGSKKEFRRFLYYARGSLVELETLMIISSNEGFLCEEDRDQIKKTRIKIARTIQGLISTIPE